MSWKYTKEKPLRVFEAFSGNSIVVNCLEGIFFQMFSNDAVGGNTLFG